jgi:hypothetical protein
MRLNLDMLKMRTTAQMDMYLGVSSYLSHLHDINKGVFGLTFSFGFCPPKSQKPTKGLDPGSSFF